MPKKKKASAQRRTQDGVSKMGAIKAVLGAGVTRPAEVADQVKKEYNFEVEPRYVSQVKLMLKKAAEKTGSEEAAAPSESKPAAPKPRAQKRAAQKTAARKTAKAAPSDKLDAAIDFCAGVGGLKAAKALLDKIERIRKL